MLKNYIVIAVRSILRQRVYSFINVLGLAIGLACCIMIFMYVEDEYSYDDFHKDADRIYKVVLKRSYPDHVRNYSIIPHSFTHVFTSDIPEVEQTVRIIGNNPGVRVSYQSDNGDEVSFEEDNFLLADSNFFDVFTIPVIRGDVREAFAKPQSVVLTQSTAIRYFGDEEPLGKSITSDFGEFLVVAVCRDVPENSHFQFDFLASATTFPFLSTQNFTGFSAHTYLVLRPGADPISVQSKFPQLVEKYAAPQIEQNMNTSYADYIANGNGYSYTLQNIRDIHLDPTNYELEFKRGGNRNDVYVFMSIAVLILVIACINFMNLAIARSTERSKEVGIRKTLGGQRRQLMIQFLTESVIISIFSLVLASLIVYLSIPYFNLLVQKSLVMNLNNSLVLPALLAFTVMVGLLAGSYPAFVLSSFNPTVVIKGVMKKGGSGSWMRNGLVVLQFTISIILIVSTLIMHDQMNFIRSKDLGFDRNNMLIVNRAAVLQENYMSYVNELSKLPGIVSAGGSNSIVAGQYFGIMFKQQGANEVVTTNGMILDDQFIQTMDFEIIEGRGFSRDRNDSLSIIINEETAKLLGSGNALGTKLEFTAGDPPVTVQLEVIGIVKNFHYMSLRDEISPFVLMSNETFGGGQDQPNAFITVKVSGDYGPVLIEMEKLWKERVPGEPFKYTFLDSELDELYSAEVHSGQRISTFASLAIVIACIGLFGLSAYTAGLRTKEIGVRKVMGASVGKVVILLSGDFTRLVLLAFLIAVPIGWYSMHQWLENFSYRVDIRIMNFIWAGIITLAISWITVSYQSFKAARVNPVRSLRSE